MSALLFACEPRQSTEEDRARLSAWRDTVSRLGLSTDGDPLELVDVGSALEHDRVVVVVREQLDHLNALYCRSVLAMHKVHGFDSYVDRHIQSGRHDLAKWLNPLLDASGTEVVAVPFSRVDEGTSPSGPVLVTAIRLLAKRMDRLGLADDEAVVSDAVNRLRARAAREEWDTRPFWGWSAELAAETAARFQPGNAELAHRLWGSDWPDPPMQREQTRQDLASYPPAVVHDVMETIQGCVDSLRTDDDDADDRPDDLTDSSR